MSENDHSRVTLEGKKIGKETARMANFMVKQLEAKGIEDQRCKTCAFREGTVPNGCLQTQADVMKCVIEGNIFLCHQNLKTPAPCFGYLAARSSIIQANGGQDFRAKVPWDYSVDDGQTK